MGCSASRRTTFLTTPTEEPSSSSSHSSHSSSSHSRAPASRTFSLPTPLVHHPPLRKGDTHHLVSLTSTTYGSLLLLNHNPTNPNPGFNGQDRPRHSPSSSPPPNITKNKASTDPKEISSPDSVINTWELMDGLDDFDVDTDYSTKPNASIHDLPIESPKKPTSFQYSGCDGSVKKLFDSFESVRSAKLVEDKPISKPLWKHLSEESLLAKMDPNVVWSYRRALSSRQLGYDNQSKTIRSLGSSPLNSSQSNSGLLSAGAKDRIVLYFTSLRGIRKTYEDCCAVRMIFRGFRVAVDERDISMDSTYRKELQSALEGKAVSLPQVFIRGKYVGGADEIKQLHEIGELGKFLEGFPIQDPGFVCNNCGDARFMPCPNCNGSRKVFEEDEGLLRRCPDCNENGLIRCPNCCS
ncbi:hypothetical protein L1049_009370 [Liquidambar formosana]|uniref:Glutaredoxin domain-containing protein n=1 Tax=Liquidambar formosana TaxID=63359 RepID=A0AAP0SAW5_LIQFO